MTKFFSTNMFEGHAGSSAGHVLNSINTKLAENYIPWQVVSAIGVDNQYQC